MLIPVRCIDDVITLHDVITLLRYNTVPTTGSPPWNFKQEVRTTHEATAVKKGVKWAANKWLHVGDFVNNWAKGNTM